MLLLIPVLLFSLTGDLHGRDYWGLRNINTRLPDEEYERFNAHYYAFAVSWARSEISDDEFTWQTLDNSLEMTERLGGEAVLVVSCNSSWACGGDMRAPDDLDRRTSLADDPPEHGYSEALYDFTYRLVEHIAELDAAHAPYLRFVNEPEYNWVIDRDWEQSVEDYVRCLRTFYIAAHAAADDNDIEIAVSHGGFNLVRSLARKYHRLGEADEELQDSLITLLQSRFERHATRIEDWEDVTRLVVGRGGMPPNYWADVMAGQTAWLDWFDIHYHFKPRFIFDELGSFEETVQDSGGEVKPWLAAEAAMQLAEGGLTEYEERFHAGDMARKWILGMAFGLEGICTPLTGYPPDHFFGLYDDNQEEYLSAQTYRFLRSLIQPVREAEDLSDSLFRRYSFHEETSDVRVKWEDALFDSWEGEPYVLVIRCSEEYSLVTVYNVLGEVLTIVQRGNFEALAIEHTNDFIVIVYQRSEKVDNGSIHITPDGFQLLSVYPNPFNSIFTVSYNLNGRASVDLRLYSISGIEVWSSSGKMQNAGQYQVTIDCSGLASGVYLLRLETANATSMQKVALIR